MENLSNGITVLVIGMAVVFSVLIVLLIVTSLFKFVFSSSKNEQEKNIAKPASVPAKPAAEFQPGFDTEDGELIAVIASSIAAHLNTGSGDIKIRSIKKVN